VVPETIKLHVPTDLLGMTLGFYEDGRTDGNDEASVATFCSKVGKQVETQGLFTGHSGEELRELAVRFDCCQSWIGEEKKRVDTKKQISAQVDAFCRAHPVNKHRLLLKHETGYYIALFAAIRFRPEPRDWELILGIRPNRLPSGFAYYKLMEAVETLKTTNKVTGDQLKKLKDWLGTLPDANPTVAARIAAL